MVFYYIHRLDWYSMTVVASSRAAIIAETATITATTEIVDATMPTIMTATMTARVLGLDHPISKRGD
jgi:hypothetical protein